MTDAIETHAFVYAGPRQLAGLVAQTLREDGLAPETWTTPGPQPGISTVVEAESLAEESWITPEPQPGASATVEADAVIVVFLACISEAQPRVALAKARERLRGRGTIDWEDAAPSTRTRRDKKMAGPTPRKAGPANQQLSAV
jgi:hypothetical protein